jgi:hypothetical protein
LPNTQLLRMIRFIRCGLFQIQSLSAFLLEQFS